MKKRLVSTLLMGALFVTSMSVFTSCKDYDDDINGNTKLISELQSEFAKQQASIDALKSDLTAQINTANSTAQTARTNANQALEDAKKAQEAADAAAAAAKAAQAAADAAKATGDEALAKAKQAEADAATAEANAQKGIADAKTAQATADAAKAAAAEAAAAAAAAKVEILEQLNAQVAQLQAAIDGKVSKEEFDKIIATLATTDGLNAALATVNAEIAKLQEQLNATNAALEAHEADVKANMDDAKDKIAGVQGTVKAIQDKLNELYDNAVRKGDFDTAIALLEARLEGIEKNLATLKNYDDTAIRELISGNAAAIAANSSAIGANTTAIAANAAAIAALQQTVLQIAVNTAAIEALDARIGNLEEAVKQIENLATKEALDNALLALNAAIATKANQEDVDEAIAALAATLGVVAASADASFEALETQIAGIIADVEAIKAGATTSEDLDKVKADIAALEAVVATLASKTDLLALEAAFEATLEAKLANLNDNLIAVINNKVDGLLVQIDAISGISGEVQTLSGKVTDNATAIANLQTTMQVLNQLMDGLGSRISVLEGKTGQYDAYDGRISILEGKVKAYDGYEDRIKTLEGDLAGLNSALNEINDILNNLKNVNGNNPEDSRLSSLGANATSNASALAEVLTAMTTEIKHLNHAVYDLQEKIKQISLFTYSSLTSLVYRPEGDNAYLYGFPTIKATLLEEQKVYKFAYNKAADNDVRSDNGKASKQFDIVAKYWLNPSNTDITKYKFGFDEVAGKNVITRGNQDNLKAGIGAKVIGVDNKGILSVALTINNASNVNDALTLGDTHFSGVGRSTYAWLTTVALQAVRNDADNETKKDTVTSDYAVIVPDYCKDLILANGDFASQPHVKGNRLYHLHTVYDELKAENKAVPAGNYGGYSYELPYNKTLTDGKFVDLTKIEIHYNNGAADNAVMSHKDAIDRGFEFVYTILNDQDKKYFDIEVEKDDNGKETSAKLYVKNTDLASVGQYTNVRVELQAGGKTFAYGYFSVVITNDKVEVVVDLTAKAALALDCEVTASVKWTDLKKMINEAINGTGTTVDNINNYDWSNAVGVLPTDIQAMLTKSGAADSKQGTISANGTANNSVFQWYFGSSDAVKKAFFDNKTLPYETWLKLTPKAGHKELPVVWLNIQITKVTYPTASYAYTDRIKMYWFKQDAEGNGSTLTADENVDRKEIHGNVEVVGQELTTEGALGHIDAVANDEFVFNVASSFYNQGTGENAFILNPDPGFTLSDRHATLYFNANKYYVFNAADNNKSFKTIAGDKYKTSTATGASGAVYALYLPTATATTLYAVEIQDKNGVAKNFNTANEQKVVVLSEEYNKVATYQGLRDETYSYARDLLNYKDHNDLAFGETFTTHMLLVNNNYCLPWIMPKEGEENFGAEEFDIRYLRPISANKSNPDPITDATDGNTEIYLTDLLTFTDWRDYDFSNSYRRHYIQYYGIKAIHVDLDKATTDINGAYDLLKHFPGIEFTDETGEATPADQANYSLFRTAIGKLVYRNNGLNVGLFHVKLPISIVYDWGETAPEILTVTIKKSEGQAITAREQ